MVFKTLIAAAALFALAMLAMAVGALFGRRSLRGTCGGGRHLVTRDGQVLACPRCDCERQRALRDSSGQRAERAE